MRPVDKAALLRWLNDKTNSANPVVYAIYKGLAERVSRGDFDMAVTD